MKLWTLCKISLIIVCAFTFTLYVLSFYFNLRIRDVLRFKPSILSDQRVTNSTKRILFWNTMFGNESFYMGQGDIFAGCPVNDCYATHDRRYTDLSNFDAVLFHGNELELSDLPENRRQRQWYVFVSLESPANWPLANHYYEDFFNLTMTYRLDSDVPWTYGVVKDTRTGRIVAPSNRVRWNEFYNRTGGRDIVDRRAEDASLSRLIHGKTRPVAWFVSNCVAKSGRQAYVDELSKHIDVDIYGRCGDKYCSRNVDCFAEVAEPGYYFYLSFENTFCDDYVTEKLYNALRYNVVPIVYGGADYSRFTPPRSHINVLDFDTPKELADYLKKLMSRPREYGDYFAWKRYYNVDTGTGSAVCNLCKFLHERKQPRMYDTLSNWYSRSRCPLQEFLRHSAYLTGSALKNKD